MVENIVRIRGKLPEHLQVKDGQRTTPRVSTKAILSFLEDAGRFQQTD